MTLDTNFSIGNAGLPPHLFTKSPGGGGGGWDRH